MNNPNTMIFVSILILVLFCEVEVEVIIDLSLSIIEYVLIELSTKNHLQFIRNHL